MINRIENGVPPTTNKHVTRYITEGDSVSSMASDMTYIIPPVGKVWQILNMFLLTVAPLGAATGTHYFSLGLAGTMNILKGESVFGSNLRWDYSQWDLADSEQKPSDVVAAQNALSNTHIITEGPLNVLYRNNTDVTQTLPRYLFFSILETPLI